MSVFINHKELFVYYSQWVRDGLAFERLSDCENPCPARKKFPEEDTCPTIDEHRVESSEAIKVHYIIIWHRKYFYVKCFFQSKAL